MRIREAAIHPQFNTDVLKPLQIENIMDQEVCDLFHRLYPKFI
jgi:ATP-binding cassette subfamily E protein 1